MRRALVVGLPALAVVASLASACGDDEPGGGPVGPGIGTNDGGGTGTPPTTPTSTPPPGGGDPDGGDAGGEPPLRAPDFFVDPTSGDDANDGKTAGAAVKTLCKAKDLAGAAGDDKVIGLAAGAYDDVSQRPVGWLFSFPCGPDFAKKTHVQGPASGEAVLSVPVVFQAGGSIRNVKLTTERDSGGVKARGNVTASGGELDIRGVSFADVFSPSNAKSAALSVSGTAKVRVFPGGVTNYLTEAVPAGQALVFAFVTAPAELTVEGGMFEDSAVNNEDTSCAPLFEGSGKLTLRGGVVVRHKGTAIRATGMTASIDQATILENRSGKFNVGCSTTIGMLGAVDIKLSGATIRGGTSGVETEGNASGTLSIEASTLFEGASDEGIKVGGAGALAVKVRRSSVKSGKVGLRIGGAIVADLGKAADPGENFFTGSPTTSVVVDTATTTVDAVGNTWNANVQDADGAGRYTPQLKEGPLNGQNLQLTGAAQKIQL